MHLSFDDWFAAHYVTVKITVRDPGSGTVLHRRTDVSKDLPMPALEAFCDLLGSLVEFSATNPYPYSAAEADAIRARFASDAYDDRTEPKWQHVYAERAAAGIYNHHKETVCMLERTSRYGRTGGPTHLVNHHHDYCRDSFAAMMPKLQSELLGAARALTALRIGQPDVTDAEIAMQVVDAFLSLLTHPHPSALGELYHYY